MSDHAASPVSHTGAPAASTRHAPARWIGKRSGPDEEAAVVAAVVVVAAAPVPAEAAVVAAAAAPVPAEPTVLAAVPAVLAVLAVPVAAVAPQTGMEVFARALHAVRSATRIQQEA